MNEERCVRAWGWSPGWWPSCSNPPSLKWSCQSSPLRLTETISGAYQAFFWQKQNFPLGSRSRICRRQNQSKKLPSGVRASAVGVEQQAMTLSCWLSLALLTSPELTFTLSDGALGRHSLVQWGLPPQDTVGYAVAVPSDGSCCHCMVREREQLKPLVGVRGGEARLWFRSV